MVLFYEEFADRLRDAVPEFSDAIDEHIADNFGEVLAHPLFGDLTRFTLAARTAGDEELVSRVLTFVDLALGEGDEAVRNIVEASFVENVGPWDDAMLPFIEAWPDRLKTEAYRQRSAQPPG